MYYYYSDTDKDSLGFIDISQILHVEIVSEIQFEIIAASGGSGTMQKLGLGRIDPRKYWNPEGTYKYQLQILGTLF